MIFLFFHSSLVLYDTKTCLKRFQGQKRSLFLASLPVDSFGL